MDAQESRKRELKAYIDAHFKSVNDFAVRLGRAPSYFQEVLETDKAFGERAAKNLVRQLAELHLPRIRFTGLEIADERPTDTGVVVPFTQGWPFSLQRERFDRLTEVQKSRLDGYILGIVEMLESEGRSSRSSSKKKKETAK